MGDSYELVLVSDSGTKSPVKFTVHNLTDGDVWSSGWIDYGIPWSSPHKLVDAQKYTISGTRRQDGKTWSYGDFWANKDLKLSFHSDFNNYNGVSTKK